MFQGRARDQSGVIGPRCHMLLWGHLLSVARTRALARHVVADVGTCTVLLLGVDRLLHRRPPHLRRPLPGLRHVVPRPCGVWAVRALGHLSRRHVSLLRTRGITVGAVNNLLEQQVVSAGVQHEADDAHERQQPHPCPHLHHSPRVHRVPALLHVLEPALRRACQRHRQPVDIPRGDDHADSAQLAQRGVVLLAVGKAVQDVPARRSVRR
mmetsp:Transcript_67036/g.139713  ORF Transcript_67036/g.139713 Transcript_67036/m.139713 type:complete len:210 (+) Transcript_67036:345-974(+)